MDRCANEQRRNEGDEAVTVARDDILAAHRALVGLTGEALADALVPTASAAVRAGIDTLSTCELEAAAAIRAAFGLPDPEPYVPGGDHAARALYTLTGGGLPYAVQPGGALRVPTLEEPPGVADGIWYGPAPGHPEHVDGCIVEANGAGSVMILRVIAGGQQNGHGHSSAIAEVRRVLVWDGHGWRCQATGRPVWCVIDADALIERLGNA